MEATNSRTTPPGLERRREARIRKWRLVGHLVEPFFLKGYPQVIEAHFTGHRLRETLREGRHGLACAVGCSRCAIDLRRAVLIETHGELRARTRFKSRESRKWHHLPPVTSDVELANVSRSRAIIAFGLDVTLPLATKAVEIVDEQAAHERLERFVDVANGNALLNHLVAVHIHELLRHVGQKRRAQAGNLRTFPRSCHKGLQIRGKKSDVFASAIFQDKRKAAGSANARNGWGRKGKSDAFRNGGEFLIDALLDGLKLLIARLAVVPRLQGHEKEGVVTSAHEAKQTEANHASGVLNARRVGQGAFDFPGDFVGALQRGGAGELQIDVHITLGVVGQKAGRNFAAKPAGSSTKSGQQTYPDRAL